MRWPVRMIALALVFSAGWGVLGYGLGYRAGQEAGLRLSKYEGARSAWRKGD